MDYFFNRNERPIFNEPFILIAVVQQARQPVCDHGDRCVDSSDHDGEEHADNLLVGHGGSLPARDRAGRSSPGSSLRCSMSMTIVHKATTAGHLLANNTAPRTHVRRELRTVSPDPESSLAMSCSSDRDTYHFLKSTGGSEWRQIVERIDDCWTTGRMRAMKLISREQRDGGRGVLAHRCRASKAARTARTGRRRSAAALQLKRLFGQHPLHRQRSDDYAL